VEKEERVGQNHQRIRALFGDRREAAIELRRISRSEVCQLQSQCRTCAPRLFQHLCLEHRILCGFQSNATRAELSVGEAVFDDQVPFDIAECSGWRIALRGNSGRFRVS
jgi:hypothetical protein